MVAKFNVVPYSAGAYRKYLEREAKKVDTAFATRAFGRGAVALGILGRPLTAKEFVNVAQGKSPDGTKKLGRAHRFRQWGFEMVFSCPSRISAAMQVLDERQARQLVTAVEKAAHDAMAHVERHASYTRVTTRGVKRREPIDLVYFAYTHVANRNGEANAHVHIVVMSRGVRRNGQWAAIENAHVLNNQKPTRRVFNQALAHHVEKDLGLHVVRTKKGIGIKGVDAEWGMTERRREIQQELKRTRRAGPKAATKATLDTRRPKENVSFTERLWRWREKANRAGRYASDLFKRVRNQFSDQIQDFRADRCYKLGAKYVRENVTSFGAGKVDEVAALFATTRNISPERLAKAGERFRAEPHRYGIVQTGENLGQPVFTSTRRQSHEDKLYGQLARLSKTSRGGLSDYKLARALAGSDQVNADTLQRVQRLVAAKGVVAGESTALCDPALPLAAAAYARNKVPVVAIGSTTHDETRLNRQLDVTSYTAARFVEMCRPPGRTRCVLAKAVFGRGNPHQRMKQAEEMRRTRLRLPKKCVVVAELGRHDIQEARAIVRAVKEARGKLILTGSESQQINEQIQRRLRGERFTQEFRNDEQQQQSQSRSLTRR